MTNSSISKLIEQERLPQSFDKVISEVYQPICAELERAFRNKTGLSIIGINGCPDSSKPTMALFLKAIFESETDLTVEIVSIDDFYKTKRERQQLAKQVHPLFVTRGVPGTHDVDLALDTLKN